MGSSSRNQGDHLRRCPGKDKQNGWWGVDRWAWGSDRHMPSTKETMFKNIHAEIKSPERRHGKLITMNAAAESKLGLWRSKKKRRKHERQLTVPDFSLSQLYPPIPLWGPHLQSRQQLLRVTGGVRRSRPGTPHAMPSNEKLRPAGDSRG